VTDCAGIDYLEIFKAADPALLDVRRRLAPVRFGYHGEGVWVTEPGLEARDPGEIETACRHAAALGSPWINVECATKQMAGYSFGTYLPPLFEAAAADVIARNAAWVQQRLDAASGGQDTPLLLLEVPPLTYFRVGDLDVADLFRRIADGASCGIVLDIGHLWTHFRYAPNDARTIEAYLHDLLARFPLERVVQIHVAGLAPHETDTDAQPVDRPRWLDAHPAAIPPILYGMLDQVLAHPRLTQLRGVALEVDGKAISETAGEYAWFEQRFGARIRSQVHAPRPRVSPSRPAPACTPPDDDRVGDAYRRYAERVSGRAGDAAAEAGLARYRDRYLPHELLVWGGDVREMFPETCRALDAAGIAIADFVPFWFRAPRPAEAAYDFFVAKVDRFVEFIEERLPSAAGLAEREAAALREGYAEACEPQPVPHEAVR
jgi:uncharacterized protein (UPF0276 family)